MRRVQYAALAASSLLGGAASYHMYVIDSINESSLVLFMLAGVFWFIIGDMDVDKMLANAQARLEQDA